MESEKNTLVEGKKGKSPGSCTQEEEKASLICCEGHTEGVFQADLKGNPALETRVGSSQRIISFSAHLEGARHLGLVAEWSGKVKADLD